MSSGGTSATVAWRVLLFAVVTALPLVVLTASVKGGYPLGDFLVDATGLAAYGGMAGVVIFRRDGNAVGWLLLALGATVILVSNMHVFRVFLLHS